MDTGHNRGPLPLEDEQIARGPDGGLPAGPAGHTPDVEASAIVSVDGLIIVSSLPAGVEEDRVSAMSATMHSLGERIASELGRRAGSSLRQGRERLHRPCRHRWRSRPHYPGPSQRQTGPGVPGDAPCRGELGGTHLVQNRYRCLSGVWGDRVAGKTLSPFPFTLVRKLSPLCLPVFLPPR